MTIKLFLLFFFLTPSLVLAQNLFRDHIQELKLAKKSLIVHRLGEWFLSLDGPQRESVLSEVKLIKGYREELLVWVSHGKERLRLYNHSANRFYNYLVLAKWLGVPTWDKASLLLEDSKSFGQGFFPGDGLIYSHFYDVYAEPREALKKKLPNRLEKQSLSAKDSRYQGTLFVVLVLDVSKSMEDDRVKFTEHLSSVLGALWELSRQQGVGAIPVMLGVATSEEVAVKDFEAFRPFPSLQQQTQELIQLITHLPQSGWSGRELMVGAAAHFLRMSGIKPTPQDSVVAVQITDEPAQYELNLEHTMDYLKQFTDLTEEGLAFMTFAKDRSFVPLEDFFPKSRSFDFDSLAKSSRPKDFFEEMASFVNFSPASVLVFPWKKGKVSKVFYTRNGEGEWEENSLVKADEMPNGEWRILAPAHLVRRGKLEFAIECEAP